MEFLRIHESVVDDTVKKQKDTVCIVLMDEQLDKPIIRMNKVVRANLRVHLEYAVSVHQCPDVKYGKQVHILPLDDTVGDVTGNLFDAYMKHECLFILTHFFHPQFSCILYLVLLI